LKGGGVPKPGEHTAQRKPKKGKKIREEQKRLVDVSKIETIEERGEKNLTVIESRKRRSLNNCLSPRKKLKKVGENPKQKTVWEKGLRNRWVKGFSAS